MYKRISLAALALILAVALGTGVGHANLIQNGSFETGTNPGNFITLVSPDTTSITDWTLFQGTLDYIGTYWTAQNLSRSLDMSGDPANPKGALGGIEQSFATIAGATYEVTFYLAGNPDSQAPADLIKILNVKVGNYDHDFTFNVSGKSHSDMGWELEPFTFIAQGSTSTLQFISKTASGWGPALDNVTVNYVVPLPSTMLLLSSGLVGLGLLRRKWSLKK